MDERPHKNSKKMSVLSCDRTDSSVIIITDRISVSFSLFNQIRSYSSAQSGVDKLGVVVLEHQVAKEVSGLLDVRSRGPGLDGGAGVFLQPFLEP